MVTNYDVILYGTTEERNIIEAFLDSIDNESITAVAVMPDVHDELGTTNHDVVLDNMADGALILVTPALFDKFGPALLALLVNPGIEAGIIQGRWSAVPACHAQMVIPDDGTGYRNRRSDRSLMLRDRFEWALIQHG